MSGLWRVYDPDEESRLRDVADRALAAQESCDKALHAANGRAQRLVGVAEMAVRALVRAGLNDDAAQVQAALKSALEAM